MLHRIDVYIVHVPLKIVVVTNQMFPIPPLPDAAFAFAAAALDYRFASRDGSRELRLDERPALREVGVVRRESQDRVEVIGQGHPSQDVEGVACLDQPYRRAQVGHMLNEQSRSPIGEIDCEEVDATRDVCSTIAHGGGV